MKKISVFVVMILFISGCSLPVKKTTQTELDEAVAEYKQLVEDNNALQRIISEKLGSDLSLINRCESFSRVLQEIGERFRDTEKLEAHSYFSIIKMDMEDAQAQYEKLKEAAQAQINQLDTYERVD